jgi:hypothetical protein
MRVRRRRRPLLALAAAFTCFGASSAAASPVYCDSQVVLSPGQQSKLLRFSEVVKAELEASGQSVALLARSGLNLARFGIRYSHAGFSLQVSQNTPWSVRQLYYACDEQKPRIFDQGMAGFVLGTDNAAVGYISAVLLPPDAAHILETAALDNRQALALLHPVYSPNAYAYSLRYQNCNQWVVEMLATALGKLGVAHDAGKELLLGLKQDPMHDPTQDVQQDLTLDLAPQSEAAAARARAQAWLRQQGYLPSIVEVGSRLLMWAGAFIPLVRSDDHPKADLAHLRYQVSMPASIEGFVQAKLPGAQRIEFCHNERHIVVHRGWAPVAEGCVPSPEDRVIALD